MRLPLAAGALAQGEVPTLQYQGTHVTFQFSSASQHFSPEQTSYFAFFFFFLLFVSSRSPAVPQYCSHTTNCLSFCDMTSKAEQSLQDNRDPSCENQLRIFMHSACDLQFSFISSFSSEHLHHDLLHLLSPTPFSSLAVTSTFCPRTFLKEKATRTPFFSQQPPLRIAGYCFSSACLLQTSSPPTSFW